MVRPLAVGCFFLAAACGQTGYWMLDTGCWMRGNLHGDGDP
jgi:hypothetical protein